MYPVHLSEVKKGSYFHLKNDVDSPMWFKNHYDRSTKKYSISPFDDVNKELFRKGSIIVYID